MKGFHRTKLVSSLAASAMLAVTLAPLPGFLAPANVYAATPTKMKPAPPLVQIAKQASIDTTTSTDADVTVHYRCSGGTTGASLIVTVKQGTVTGMGDNTTLTTTSPVFTCDGSAQTAIVDVSPTGTGSFNTGKAHATATLKDAFGRSAKASRDIRIS